LSFADNQVNQQLQEVVVTAQKREEKLQDVPISISVLSGTALDSSTLSGISDELNKVPGVVLQPANAGLAAPLIAMRGVAAALLQWGGASPIAYYLDTVPFGFVRSAYAPDANAFDLQRVEVLRGPQGTLYGANAEDGVVRIITNEADVHGFDLKARVLGSGTEGGGANGGGDVAINVPLIDGKLAVRAVVDYQDWSGWIDRPNDNNANASQLRNYRLKLAYQPVENLTVDLSVWSSREHSDSVALSFPDGSAPYGTTPEPSEVDFDAYGAKIGYRFPSFSLTSMTSYLRYKVFSAFDVSYLGPTLYGGLFDNLSLASWFGSRVLSEELTANSRNDSPWSWTAGLFARKEWDGNAQAGAYGMVPTYPAPEDVGFVNFRDGSRSYAAFGQIGRRFLDNKWEWTLGLRQFHDNVYSLSLDPSTPSYQSRSFNATTPRAVMSWYPVRDLTVYASFSEGFRSGVPQYYAATSVYPSAPPAQPDRLYNYEVGAKTDLWDHRVTLDTSAYYVKWKGVQQPLNVYEPNGVQLNAILNGPSASGPGVDLAVTIQPISHLRFGITSSWNKLAADDAVVSGGSVIIPKGGPLADSSRYTGSAFANVDFPLGASTGLLAFSANYTSRQASYTITPNGTPTYLYGDSLLFVQSSFTVTFQEKWSIKLYGDNLTNQRGNLGAPLTGFDPTTEGQGTARPRPLTIGLEADYRYK